MDKVHRHFEELACSKKMLCSAILMMWFFAGCGASTSWSTQLRTAQQAAANIDAQAVLISVSASPTTYDVPDGSLNIRFVFVRPSGEAIDVSFEDIHVTETLKAISGDGQDNVPSPAERVKLIQAIKFVKISAAEAIQRTLSDGRTFSTRYQGKVAPGASLLFDEKVVQTFGVPAVWDVSWLGPSGKKLELWLDAQTGAILKQELSQ
jgi:hypothetical protein